MKFRAEGERRNDQFAYLRRFAGRAGDQQRDDRCLDAPERAQGQTGRSPIRPAKRILKRCMPVIRKAAGPKPMSGRYIPDMVAEFEKADLMICRAGATTCAELAAAGKAAIMVPLPTAADDHQRKNAEALQKAGAAKMILQKDLTGEALAAEIDRADREPRKDYRRWGSAAKKLAQKRRGGDDGGYYRGIRKRTLLKDTQGKRTKMFRHVKKIHFIGIGGIGMSGIAEVLCNLGFRRYRVRTRTGRRIPTGSRRFSK